MACTSVLVPKPMTLPGGTSTPPGGSWATTTAVGPWGSRSVAPPCRPAARITVVALARVWPTASSTRIAGEVGGAVALPEVAVAPVVVGCRVLGVVGSSRPTTTSPASPASSAAAVAARVDDTRMLPPACVARCHRAYRPAPLAALGSAKDHRDRRSGITPSATALLEFRSPRRAAVCLAEEQESRILVRRGATTSKATVHAAGVSLHATPPADQPLPP